jgi:Ala-tRNA(Pro) deacylase
MPIMGKLCEYFDSHHVRYEALTHPVAFTAQETAAAQHVPGRQLAKVVIVRAAGEFAMIVLPASARLDLERAATLLGLPHLALASEDEFESLFPGCEVGAMPPLGNLYDLPVWVDRQLTTDENIVFNAGTHTQTIRMRYADFSRLVQPHVAARASAARSER